MTLAVGDKVVKLDPTTDDPVNPADESYVEYEVADVGGHVNLRTPRGTDEDTNDTYLVTLLRVIK